MPPHDRHTRTATSNEELAAQRRQARDGKLGDAHLGLALRLDGACGIPRAPRCQSASPASHTPSTSVAIGRAIVNAAPARAPADSNQMRPSWRSTSSCER